MEVVLWIILGGVAGWIASVIMRADAQQGLMMDVVLGVVGGLVGGFLFSLFGAPGVTGFNIYSLAVAVVGAVVLIAVGRMFTGARV